MMYMIECIQQRRKVACKFNTPFYLAQPSPSSSEVINH
uniref:Uncharacterized protein n=1 Tax=Rhizophora mucronata TaxID=61149 RepID=A0A2P2NFU6_RHIMU